MFATALVPLLLTQAAAPSTPGLDAYIKWRGKIDTMRTEYRFRATPTGEYGRATLLFTAGKARLTATIANQTYEMAVVDGRVIELSRNLRLYNKFEIRPGAVRFPSDFSSIPEIGYAAELLGQRFIGALPDNVKLEAQKDGATLVTEAEFQADMAQIRFRFEVNPDGSPKKYTQTVRGSSGSMYREFVFDKVEVNPAVPANAYVLIEPGNYAPWSMPLFVLGYEIGEKFPIADWRAGNAPAKAPTKPTLLVGALPGDKRTPGAMKLARELGIPVLTIGPNGQTGTDWTATSAVVWQKALGAGSPVFILLGGDGVLEHAWVGYAERIHAERKRDMLKKIKGIGEGN